MLGRGDSILHRCGRGGHCREIRVGPLLSSASREHVVTEIPGGRGDYVKFGVDFFRAEAIQPGQWLVEKLAQEARLFCEIGGPAGDQAAKFGTLRDVI